MHVLNSDLYVNMESTMIFKPNSRFFVGGFPDFDGAFLYFLNEISR